MPRPFQSPISPHLSPNATGSSLVLAASYLLNPLRWLVWRRGRAVARLEQRFRKDYAAVEALAVDSGRTALQLIIEALELTDGDEVVTQAFTCIVVPNSIIAAGGTPRYLDIDQSYNLDPAQLATALARDGSRIRAVIVQHTFGVPAQLEAIAALCKKHDVALIEDCAHALGAKVNGQLVGTFGDAAMFSFGRDKVISSVSGGLVVTSHPAIASSLKKTRSSLPLPRRSWIAQRFAHAIIFAVAKRLYYTLSLGKIIIVLSRKFHLVPDVLVAKEKHGQAPSKQYLLPNGLADWAMQQYETLPLFNHHRLTLAATYKKALSNATQKINPNTEPIYLRYSIEVANQAQLLKSTRSAGILLGDWYREVITPSSTPLTKLGYRSGSCPQAEKLSKRIVNLPTNPLTTGTQAARVIQAVSTQTR